MDGVEVRNFYFDRTPYALISSVITERGLLDTRAIQAFASKTEANVRFLSNTASI